MRNSPIPTLVGALFTVGILKTSAVEPAWGILFAAAVVLAVIVHFND